MYQNTGTFGILRFRLWGDKLLTLEDKVRYWGIVPAAGVGSRMSTGLPKQYLALGHSTVIEHSLKPLLACEAISQIVVAIAADDVHWPQLSLAKQEKVFTCLGADERFKSVYNGLLTLAELGAKADDWVLVHDAARPCLKAHDLQNLMETLVKHPVGGILATPVRDTLKQGADQVIVQTLSRENLWQAQTPQMFRFHLLKTALETAIELNVNVTDEAMAIERLGYQPILVLGAQDNIKITYSEDLLMAKQYLAPKCNMRIGQGFDVHEFTEGRPLMMGGVEIPYKFGLKGHSDADVVLHALCDALLGAAALGDIGQHFPDTSDENEGRDSSEFLADIYQKITQQGYHLVNADVTIIAQAPKMAPHIQAMRERISAICAVELTQINVKATTTEGLGFVGRKEGIACQVVVLLAAT